MLFYDNILTIYIVFNDKKWGLPMYTDIERAIKFATIGHNLQKRKDGISFVCHPFTVGYMLKDIGLEDKYVVMGILHDVIEDTDYTYDDIVYYFNEEIADGVMMISEDKSITDFVERKLKFMEQISNIEDNNILMIECADKLHNLLYDYEKDPRILFRYSDKRRWFYHEMQKIINRRCRGILVKRLNEMIKIMDCSIYV